MDKNVLSDFILENLKNILKDKELSSEINCDTMIFGEGSVIDSLDLVNLIVAIENYVEKTAQKSITIVDEDSIITSDSPFRSINTLSEHIMKKINEK